MKLPCQTTNRHWPNGLAVKVVWPRRPIRRTIRRRLDLRAMVQERPIRVERRLSAILAADAAGYSRLMHDDEEATHEKLTALLTDAVAPAITRTRWPHCQEHRGRVLGGVSERSRSGSSCCAGLFGREPMLKNEHDRLRRLYSASRNRADDESRA
jgi:hypothetical protein